MLCTANTTMNELDLKLDLLTYLNWDFDPFIQVTSSLLMPACTVCMYCMHVRIEIYLHTVLVRNSQNELENLQLQPWEAIDRFFLSDFFTKIGTC